MEKKRERKNKLEFYVSEEEKAFIYAKMNAAKISNLSAYMRKIAIDGKIEIKDLLELKNMNYNLHKIGVNINQIAKRINETNAVYQSDIQDVMNKQNEIWELQKQIISRLVE